MENDKSRVTKITIGRLHNLGNYEHIRYEVEVTVSEKDNPSEIVTTLERILNDIQLKASFSSHDLKRAKEALAKPIDELSEWDKENLDTYKERVRKFEEIKARREAARVALNTLSYSEEYTDHKLNWDDDGW